MSWNADFRAALRDPQAGPAIYVVERVEAYREPGSTWEVASVQGVGAPGLALEAPELGGQSVQPRTWSSVMGGFSFQVVGDLAAVTTKITRGTVLAVRLGFASLPQDRWERVALGQLRSVRLVSGGRSPAPRWRFEAVDLATALRSRLVRRWYNQRLLASNLNTTTVSASWSPGDTTLEVADPTTFGRTTGGYGALRATTSGGSTFLLLYTGTATGPARFTGVVDDVMGTTPVALSAGDVVAEIAYYAGHPIDIARRFLVSRGDGTNGPHDVYPELWALGIHSSLVDDDDCDAFKAISSAASWQYELSAAQGDPMAWMSGLLAEGGFFLAMRQGRVTVRCAQRTRGITDAVVANVTITDDDIEEVEGYDAWDPSFDFEYSFLTTTTFSDEQHDGTEDVATLPGDDAFYRELADRAFTDEADQRDDLRARLLESTTRIPERIALRLVGCAWAELAVGDIVRLETTRLQSRRHGRAGFNDYVWVQAVTPLYGRRAVRVVLLCYPETEEMYG